MRHAVVVTAADSAAGAVEALAERLRTAGMEVDQVLAAVGLVTGSVDGAQLASISALPGVLAVEEQRTVQLAPPDADVQ